MRKYWVFLHHDTAQDQEDQSEDAIEMDEVDSFIPAEHQCHICRDKMQNKDDI